MTSSTPRRQRGLSLIEVFVALLVLSVGLIALARLQVDLVRGGSDAKARTMALNLVEEKIDDLRSFTVAQGSGTWSAANSATIKPMAWSYIDTNAGGRIPSQPVVVSGVNFTRTWALSNQYPSAIAAAPRTKDVTVTVSWLNELGVQQSVSGVASVVEIPPGNVAMASEPLSTPPSGPQVVYTPGAAPEVISVPIDTGTGKRETTKPLPDVQAAGGYSHEVTFDVVNYHRSGSNNVVDRREEFDTVNCRCALATGARRTPARWSFAGNVLRDQPGAIVGLPPAQQPVETGVVLTSGTNGKSQQPVLCGICCRDHHDGPVITDASGNTDYNRYNPIAKTDHSHYLATVASDGTVSYASPSSANDYAYDEACRLKRINGVFQVFQDWQLQTVTVMPKTDLANSDGSAGINLLNYTLAVQQFVKDAVSAQDSGSDPPAKLPTFTPSAVSVNPETPQLLARAIYIDYMPQGLLDAINTDPSNISQVPFYEVHMTKLADWSMYPNLTNALVSSDAIQDDPTGVVTNAIYSRGFVQPAAIPPGGTPTAVASIKSHNTGITATTSVDVSYEAPHPTTAYSVGNGNNASAYYYTAIKPSDETPTATSQHKDGTLDLTVRANAKVIVITGTFGSGQCSGDISGTASVKIGNTSCDPNGALGGNGNAAAETFSCTVLADANGQWNGTVTFALPPYVFCSDNGNNKTMCTPLPKDASGNYNWTPPGVPLTQNSTQNTIYVSTPACK